MVCSILMPGAPCWSYLSKTTVSFFLCCGQFLPFSLSSSYTDATCQSWSCEVSISSEMSPKFRGIWTSTCVHLLTSLLLLKPLMRNMLVHRVRPIYLESSQIHTEHCGKQDNPIYALLLWYSEFVRLEGGFYFNVGLFLWCTDFLENTANIFPIDQKCIWTPGVYDRGWKCIPQVSQMDNCNLSQSSTQYVNPKTNPSQDM